MLTRLQVRNFKRFDELDISLANPVVFVGPNNSGKTSAMQALALWELGLRRWNERWGKREASEERPGVTVNRRDITAIPIRDAKALWNDLHIRDVVMVEGKPRTENVRIDIIVEGDTGGGPWACGFEFDYANPESIYCRPLRIGPGKSPPRMRVPDDVRETRIAMLPPMSGLASEEAQLQPGAVNVRIGQGRTAEVLRNLCLQVHEQHEAEWKSLVSRIEHLFGVKINAPEFVVDRGEIEMTYEHSGATLDLSAAGRGLQQTVLLLAYIFTHRGAVLMLDEPDAHLEILRQREIYSLLKEVAREQGNQLIIATHSEVLLNQSAGTDQVIAFVGKPHPIGQHSDEVRKSLAEIGWSDYQEAERAKYVIYVEGPTDISILREFARHLDHNHALEAISNAFIRYAGNDMHFIRRHFHGLREAVPQLRGLALLDHRSAEPLNLGQQLSSRIWTQREIENYLCSEESLISYARSIAKFEPALPLFQQQEDERVVAAMTAAIREVESAAELLGKPAIWSAEAKASDDVLVPILRAFHKHIDRFNDMPKANLYRLVNFITPSEVDKEVLDVLQAITDVAESATPAGL